MEIRCNIRYIIGLGGIVSNIVRSAYETGGRHAGRADIEKSATRCEAALSDHRHVAGAVEVDPAKSGKQHIIRGIACSAATDSDIIRRIGGAVGHSIFTY